MPRRWLAILAAVSMLNGTGSPLRAQPAPPPLQQPSETGQFDVQQIDALLAPIALYPDQLLTQVLIASTFPIEIVEASRWIEDPTHKDLKGDALAKAIRHGIRIYDVTCNGAMQKALLREIQWDPLGHDTHATGKLSDDVRVAHDG